MLLPQTEAMQHALSLAMHVSPTGKEQQQFSALYNALRAEIHNEKEFLTRFVGTIYDGLAYGNWPH